ncbi:MAG: S8 family serine peptidase [Bacteroidetes bacterium]|nr:S8 family serine peptidase [Bacteroidota bacterium]
MEKKFFSGLSVFFITALIVGVFIFAISKNTKTESSFSSIYEDKNYIEGEILVSLNGGANINNLLADYSNIGLRVKERLIPDMNIYLLEFDKTRMSSIDALISIKGKRDVSVAQFNHIVQQRVTTPNDTRFAEQWDMNNTGQSGGTPDADIDAPEAWDIATGGNTAMGDTIVVCVVDGGGDLTHPDITWWKNYQEIPGNGIDDDGNGYIDDYDGWNAISNNGTIPSNSHATHVSGTVGAKGNNSQGVAGVNWKVKVMPVNGSTSSEAVAIKAYGYPYKMRKLYNETNGTKGAFVVSTNSSFGVDNGQPSNFPLWCAMYDSLGRVGVLSAGAGPNNNVNIDVVGDIPTACPSPWLIAVTNTTNTDVKNSGAGYGPINMDLGAPGTNILSTLPGNTYGNNTGTSMATPHVAGAVGLMYNAAGINFIQLGKIKPDSLATYMKFAMLSTVDTLASLQTLVLSKGRLNLFKAVNKVKVSNVPVLNNFSLTSPAAGTTVTTLPGSSQTVTFMWDTSATGASYKFIFGSPSAPNRQITIGAGTNSVTMTLGALDNILAGLGVAQGNSLVGSWDVWASRQLPTVDSLKSQNGPRAVTLTRGVPTLSAFNLVSPASGTTITTSGFNNSNVNFSWTRSGQGTFYRWMFDAPTFAGAPLFRIMSGNSGNDSTLSLVNSSLDLMLGQAGLNPGDSLAGQWRVYAYRNATDSAASVQTYALTFKRQAKGDVLVAYDSTSANCRISRDSVTTALSNLGVTFDFYNRGTSSATTSISFRGYKKVIWLGEGTSTIANPQKDSLKSYLTAGGTTVAAKSKLIIFSEDIGYNHDRAGATYLDTVFTRQYLGIVFIADRPSVGAGNVGLKGLQISSGIKDSIAGTWPDVIKKSSAGSTALLYGYRWFNSSDSVNAIGRQANTFNTATFSLDIEALRNTADGPTSSPVRRIVKAALDYVDQLLVSSGENTSLIPSVFELKQNYPNPFNPVTKISYSIPKAGIVTLKIFDVTGREVASLMNELKQPGVYAVDFNASSFASGVYFYRLESADFVDTKRMVLLK